MQLTLSTGMFGLVDGDNNLLCGTARYSRDEAEMLLSDRQANGEAFPREAVSEIMLKTFSIGGSASAGKECFQSYLVAAAALEQERFDAELRGHEQALVDMNE
jgi:hypothetical protein